MLWKALVYGWAPGFPDLLLWILHARRIKAHGDAASLPCLSVLGCCLLSEARNLCPCGVPLLSQSEETAPEAVGVTLGFPLCWRCLWQTAEELRAVQKERRAPGL